MGELTARERYYAVTHFEPGVRTLLWELVYWVAAIERWYREGLPKSPWSPPLGQRPGDGVYGDGGTLYPPPPSVRYRDLDVHNFLGLDKGCVLGSLSIGDAIPPSRRLSLMRMTKPGSSEMEMVLHCVSAKMQTPFPISSTGRSAIAPIGRS